MKQQPYLSIILTSRNDDYAGGMLPRLQICIDSLLEQAARHCLALELVLVDWNPPATKAALQDAVDWSRVGNGATIRAIQVPPELHRQLPFADQLPFLAHTARNVGARRATGTFVLVTATDILFSESLIAYLASQPLDAHKNYRIDRVDVPEQVIQIDSVAQRLTFCENHMGYTYQRPTEKMYSLPLLHTRAPGDFVLLSRENFNKLHGIPEERDYHSIHFDTVFCYMMYALGLEEEILLPPHRIYHMDHPSFTTPQPIWLQSHIQRLPLLKKRRRNQLSWLAGKLFGPPSSLERLGVPSIDQYGRRKLKRMLIDLANKREPIAYNDQSWGLGEHELPETIIQRTQSTMSPVANKSDLYVDVSGTAECAT